jgi:hypothetical protein
MTRPEMRLDDAAFDRLLAGALSRHADGVAAAQPSTGVALARLSVGVGARQPSRLLGPRTTAVAWLALLLLAGTALVAVGSHLIRQDQPNRILLSEFGPRSSCASPVADGMPIQAFRDEAVLMVDRSGLVTILSGDGNGSPPQGEGAYRTRVESRFVNGVLTPAGTSMLVDRILGLGLEAGCYSLRTQAGDSAIFANTSQGPLGLSFSWGNGIGSVAPRLDPAEEERLKDLLDALFAPGSWLPADAFTPMEPADLDAWIVHTTFRPMGPEPRAGDDGRYTAVRLPGGVSVEEFGDAMPGSPDEMEVIIAGYVDVRAANQRCGVIDRSDAVALADSLDAVGWGSDLHTPDGATAVTIQLHPAVGTHSTCAGFADSLNGYVAPSPAPAATPTGDLAAVDPCSLVPSELRGRVADPSPGELTSPFGIAAPSCVLEWRHSMTTGGAERVLWLYPERVSEADARSMSDWIFGTAAPSSFQGLPLWLNHCAAEGAAWLECRWAVAGFSEGRYVVLEVSDPDATVDSIVATLGRILGTPR